VVALAMELCSEHPEWTEAMQTFIRRFWNLIPETSNCPRRPTHKSE